MSKGATKPMRVTQDLASKAESVATSENRTTTEQINYWARLGMQTERAASAQSRRILAVVRGEAQFSGLSDAERRIADAAIDATMAERIQSTAFGPAARAEGRVTVSIDDDGRLVEITPDGGRRHL